MNAFNYLLDLLFPPKCPFCQRVMKNEGICSACLKSLPYTIGDAQVQKLPFISKCITPLYYKDSVREAVLRYKFRGSQSYKKYFSDLICECLENNLDCGDIHVISYVPLSRKRQRKRGYNQSQLIAEQLSAKLHIPVKPLLKKIRNNPPQSKTANASRRAANVQGVYELLQNADVKGKNILLTDDVVTTGSTVSECARVLKKAGAHKVYAVAIARHAD